MIKWIKNKYTFFIVFGITVSLLTSFVIKETTIKKLRTKYHKHLTTKDALTVYSFAEGKEQLLLEVSATLLGDKIVATQQCPDYGIEKLEFLCPSLNNNVKNLILKNFDNQYQEYLEHINEYQEDNITVNIEQDKQDFNIAYDKLTKFCNSK